MVSAESGQAVADGTEVTWFASHGRIRSTSTTVGGVATTVLDATKGRFGTCTVSAGVTNFLASTTIEFTNVGQTELVVEHPVLVADETEDGTTHLEPLDGHVVSGPYYASSKVQIRGTPGATATVWASTALPTADYGFETVEDDTTPDAVAGAEATVEGALLDAENVAHGLASLSFDGAARVTVPDRSEIRIDEGFKLEVDVRPTNIAPGALLAKDGEYSLIVGASGTVSFEAVLSGEPVQVTSTAPLTEGDWNHITAEYRFGQLALTMNGSRSSVRVSGAAVGGAQDLVVGEGFEGNLDALQIFALAFGETEHFVLEGLDANGQTVLDENGLGEMTIRSTGVSLGNDWFQKVTLHVEASLQQSADVLVLRRPMADLIIGFVMGSDYAQSAWGLPADFIAGLIFYGDGRDIVIQSSRSIRGKKVDRMVLGWAVVGIVADVAPFFMGPGAPMAEAVNALAASVKVLVKTLGDCTFTRHLVDLVLSVLTHVKDPAKLLPQLESTYGYVKAIERLDDGSKQLLKAATEGLPPKVLNAVSRPLSAHDTADVTKFHEVLTQGYAAAGEVSKEAMTRAYNVLKGLDSGTLRGLARASDAADGMKGLILAAKQGHSIKYMQKAITNVMTVTPNYSTAAMLKQFGDVAHIPGADKLLKGLGNRNQNARGFRYELECAHHFLKTGQPGTLMELSSAMGRSDIDHVLRTADGKTLFVQAKRTPQALKSDKKVMKWIDRAKAELRRRGLPDSNDRIVYVVPDLDKTFLPKFANNPLGPLDLASNLPSRRGGVDIRPEIVTLLKTPEEVTGEVISLLRDIPHVL